MKTADLKGNRRPLWSGPVLSRRVETSLVTDKCKVLPFKTKVKEALDAFEL